MRPGEIWVKGAGGAEIELAEDGVLSLRDPYDDEVLLDPNAKLVKVTAQNNVELQAGDTKVKIGKKLPEGDEPPSLADMASLLVPDNPLTGGPGQIVEIGHAKTFFEEPLHPYSDMLMNSVPRLRVKKEPTFIQGQPPSLLGPPIGCRFADRCPKRFDKCSEEPPVVEAKGHQVKCWLYA